MSRKKSRPNDLQVSITNGGNDNDNDFNRTGNAIGNDGSSSGDSDDSGIGPDGFPVADAGNDYPSGSGTGSRAKRNKSNARRDFGSTADTGRTGTGNSSGSNSGPDSGSESAAGTKAGTSIPNETAPRKVAYNALGNQPSKPASLKNQAVAIEFYKELWSLGFHGLSVFFRDHEWKLPDDDAEELAERTQRLMAAGGVKRLQAAEKIIAKYQPIISLLIAVFAIVIPRLAHTKELRRNAINSKKEEKAGTTGTATATPASSGDNGIPRGTGTGPGPIDGNRRDNGGYRPIRREDWGEIYPNDDRQPS